MITLIIGFVGLVLTIISASWLSAYQFRDSLNQLDKRLGEMDRRFEANLSELRTELKSEIKITREVLDARMDSFEERLEAAKEVFNARMGSFEERLEAAKSSLEYRLETIKSELRAEILAVKHDLSYNYNERLGEVQIRVDRLEKDILPRLEQLERQTV